MWFFFKGGGGWLVWNASFQRAKTFPKLKHNRHNLHFKKTSRKTCYKGLQNQESPTGILFWLERL